MLNTRQKTLRRLLVRDRAVDALKDGPKPFKLLGQEIALFLDKDGEPAALEDRCCHRTAKLSKGWINDGNIVCGYHGWEYDRDGKLVMIPQFPFEQAVPDARAEVVPRQGALRLCLGLPRRAARRHSRADLRGRSRLPPHPSVLRPLEDLVAAPDGEFVRQRAFRLRPQRHVRRHQPAQAGEVRDHRDRLRLRRRDHRHRAQPAGRRAHHRHDRADDPAHHAQPLVSCRSAARWT